MSQPDTLPAIALTATFEAPPETSPLLMAEVGAGCLVPLLEDAAVISLDLFTPDPGKPVIFDDGNPPALHLEIGFATIEAAKAALAGDAFKAAIDSLHGAASAELTVGLYKIHREPLPEQAVAGDRSATMSFMVRYYGPVDDPAGFASHYIAHHPPLLAKFPKVHNVLAFDPVVMEEEGVFPLSPVIVGNEVVFDSVEDLNAAMLSPVMKELKADSAGFPPFGHSTHVPTRRNKLK